MADRFDIWLARVSDSGDDPVSGLRQAGLRDPRPDYASIARTIATLVERTGLLGLAGVWGDPQLVGRHFLGFGTEAQRAAWLGRARAVGISEPNVGAHPKLLTTRAEPAPKGFRVTSQKAWVTNGPCADAIIVFAITAQEAGRRRCSTFIVPRGLPGVAIAEMPGLHALRPSRHRLLTLEGCGAPESAMLGDPGSAHDRMALPFRDIEDAVGTFATVGGLRYAIGLFAGASGAGQAEALRAIVALTAVFAAAAEAVVVSLGACRFRPGNATLAGLRVLAIDIVSRLHAAQPATETRTQRLAGILVDTDATLSIARGPRLARQAHLGAAALRGAKSMA